MARRKLLTKKTVTLGVLALGAYLLFRRRQQNVAGLGFWNPGVNNNNLIWGRPVRRNPFASLKIKLPKPVKPPASVGPITTMPVKPSPISVPISIQPVKPPVKRGLFGRRIQGFTPPAPKRIVGLRFAWGK